MNNIATLRKAYYMTQEQLAEKIGVSQGTLSQYEADKRTPDGKVLLRLVEIFQKSANYILGLPEEQRLVFDNKTLSMTQVTRIEEISDYLRVNVCLLAGWRLLSILSRSEYYQEECRNYPLYILGWFGDPQLATLPESPAKPRPLRDGEVIEG